MGFPFLFLKGKKQTIGENFCDAVKIDYSWAIFFFLNKCYFAILFSL